MDWRCNDTLRLIIALILATTPNGLFYLMVVYLGMILLSIILMFAVGFLDFKFKYNKKNPLEDTAIRFNDIENTEIYITDIRGYRYALLLDKGYVIDIVTDAGETGQWVSTLRYGSRSERDKDYEALVYKLKEHGMYRGE